MRLPAHIWIALALLASCGASSTSRAPASAERNSAEKSRSDDAPLAFKKPGAVSITDDGKDGETTVAGGKGAVGVDEEFATAAEATSITGVNLTDFQVNIWVVAPADAKSGASGKTVPGELVGTARVTKTGSFKATVPSPAQNLVLMLDIASRKAKPELKLPARATESARTVAWTADAAAEGVRAVDRQTVVENASKPQSCLEWLERGEKTSKTYELTDFAGTHTAYCDMERDGGGWTLVLRSFLDNDDFRYTSPEWSLGSNLNEKDFTLSAVGTPTNSKYPAYARVAGRSFRLELADDKIALNFADEVQAKSALQFATISSIDAYTGPAVNAANEGYRGGLIAWQPSSGVCSGMYPADKAWPSLLDVRLAADWNLQAHAGAIGTNLVSRASYPAGALHGAVRFGIIADNENDGDSAWPSSGWDSVVGIGIRNYDGSGHLGSGVVGWEELGACNNLGTTSNAAGPNAFIPALLWIR